MRECEAGKLQDDFVQATRQSTESCSATGTVDKLRIYPAQTGLWVTTRAEDHYDTNVVARNRFVTGPEFRSRLYAARGPKARPVSVKTVRKQIHAGDFKSMLPAKKPELTQRHKDARLAFSRAHARWNNPQWRRVMFADE